MRNRDKTDWPLVAWCCCVGTIGALLAVLLFAAGVATPALAWLGLASVFVTGWGIQFCRQVMRD